MTEEGLYELLAKAEAERDVARAEAEKYLQNIEERQRELTTLVDTMVVRGEQAAAERAERAEAMANPTALHESSMAVHGALGWGFDPNTVSPVSLARASASLASEHVRLRSERDLLTAQLADVTRQRDEARKRADKFKEIGQRFEREARATFEQSCKNLERAERAEAERDEANAAQRRWETVLAPWWDATRAEPSAPEQVAAALLAMREAFKRLADAVIEDETLHEWNENGEQDAACNDGDGCDCELPNLINKTLSDSTTAGAAWLAEHDARVAAKQRAIDLAVIDRTKDPRIAVGELEEAALVRDARVAGEARRAALEVDPAHVAQLFHETYERLAPSHGYKTREASAKPWADVPDHNRQLMTATVREVFTALAPPAPAPSGAQCASTVWIGATGRGSRCELPFNHDGDHRAPAPSVRGAPLDETLPVAKAEPEPQCTGTLVHDAYSICPVHDAKPVCATCGGKMDIPAECNDRAVTR